MLLLLLLLLMPMLVNSMMLVCCDEFGLELTCLGGVAVVDERIRAWIYVLCRGIVPGEWCVCGRHAGLPALLSWGLDAAAIATPLLSAIKGKFP